MRSFVPKEKKSASLAISDADKAARGVSIIVPIRGKSLRPEAFTVSAISSSIQLRIICNSFFSTTNGIIISTEGSLPSPTRSEIALVIDRACMRYNSSRNKAKRTPLVPSIGLCSESG